MTFGLLLGITTNRKSMAVVKKGGTLAGALGTYRNYIPPCVITTYKTGRRSGWCPESLSSDYHLVRCEVGIVIWLTQVLAQECYERGGDTASALLMLGLAFIWPSLCLLLLDNEVESQQVVSQAWLIYAKRYKHALITTSTARGKDRWQARLIVDHGAWSTR